MPDLSLRVQRVALRLVLVAGWLLFFGLALDTAVHKSPTVDEPAHFIRGYVLWQTGDLHLQFEHAPLSHRLLGLFLQTEPEAPDVTRLNAWPTGDRLKIAAELLWKTGLDVGRMFMLARLPLIWLGMLLGALAARWAWVWHGRFVMLVVLVLFTFDPNLLAHASLATTDMATAVFYFGAVFLWWLYWQKPSRRRWLGTAVFLGLALATKLTAVLLPPILLILSFVYWRRGRSIWRPLLLWAGLLPVAAFFVWLVYGFEIGPFAGFSLPAATYWQSWRDVLTHVDSGHQAFFLGELSQDGWWSYFVVAFFLKTPLLTQILLLMGLVVIIKRRELWRTAVFLLLPAAMIFLVGILSRLNIGYRHILPALPFLLVVAGTAVLPLQADHSRLSKPLRQALIVLLGIGLFLYALNSLRQRPHYLAYFNPLVGGSAQGHKYLGDSNLDWGQDLSLLAQKINQNEAETWRVSYFGTADPLYYGLSAETLLPGDSLDAAFSPANPQPGRYALSANHVQGILPDADLFDWFRRQEPDGALGGSILEYSVSEQRKGAWVGHCLDPAPILTPQETEQWLGQAGLRHVWFDCHQTWVFPEGGASGWLILPQADGWWAQKWLPLDLEGRLQLVYRHDASTLAPSFEIYYWAGADEQALQADGYTAVELEGGTAVSLPYPLAATLQLNQYTHDDGTWFTFWEVLTPTAEPLSLQAHLVTDAPAPLVADSLGYSSEQWRPGDLFVQRYQFPGQESAQFMETGLLNYQTLDLPGPRLRLPYRTTAGK